MEVITSTPNQSFSDGKLLENIMKGAIISPILKSVDPLIEVVTTPNQSLSDDDKLENMIKETMPSPILGTVDGFKLNLSITPNDNKSVANIKKNVSSPEAQLFEFNITPEGSNLPHSILNLSTNEQQIRIPHVSKNQLNLLPSQFKNCIIKEGSFKISNAEWRAITSEGKLNGKYYLYYFKNHTTKYVNNTCSIIFKYVKYLKSGIIKVFGMCKHKSCKNFVFLIKNYKVTVFTSSINFCHKGPIATYIKGVERSLAKKALLKQNPSEYKKRTILQAKGELVKCGNLQWIKSDSTIRKIRSEALAQRDRHENDILDLILIQLEHGEYVKQVSVPFNVKIYSEQQANILFRQETDDKLPVLYFDATGGIIKKPYQTAKRIYLYSAVTITSQTRRIIPIFEMVLGCSYFKLHF